MHCTCKSRILDLFFLKENARREINFQNCGIHLDYFVRWRIASPIFFNKNIIYKFKNSNKK